ncbi:MAG: hypothetical protein FD174_700 [Geobacteraceae bacterium]|nr:MAG: hypothetical protein FD174_700 [Geobacteraceae bacterium]
MSGASVPMMTGIPCQRFHIHLGFITLLGFFLRTLLLPSQPVTWDDYSVGLTAINYMESGQLGPIMWNHPELGNILVYSALRLFGTGLVGLKGMSVIVGVLSITLVGLVSRQLLRNETMALLAALLWALDPLAIDMSRQAVHEIYMAFFPLAGIYCISRYRMGRNHWWLLAAGAGFGLGLASKWSVAFPLVVSLAFLINDFRRKGASGVPVPARMLFAAVSLMVLPAVIYILTFIPWFGQGHSVGEWLELHKDMYVETKLHVGYEELSRRDHRAYEWFIRPVSWRDSTFNNDTGEPMVEAESGKYFIDLIGVGNPFVWFLVIPAVLYLVRKCVQRRDEGLMYAAALFLASYLPLAFTYSRPIFVNAALSVMPFAMMAVAHLVVSTLCTTRARKRIFALYLALVVFATVPLYFLAIGKGAEFPFLRDYFLQN